MKTKSACVVWRGGLCPDRKQSGQNANGCHRLAGFTAGISLALLLAAGWGRTTAAEAEPPEKSALEQVRDYIAAQTEQGKIDKNAKNWRQKLPRFPDVKFLFDRSYYLDAQTGKGAFSIRLLPHAAPKHVANIMYLVELGFYDGMAFQFLKPGERVQMGCPIGDGRGTPGYTFAGDYTSGLKHDRAGLLSMANAGKNSDGCQFFITLGPMPWMDARHTIFGEVVAGMEVLDAIASGGSPMGSVRDRVIVERMSILSEETPVREAPPPPPPKSG